MLCHGLFDCFSRHKRHKEGVDKDHWTSEQSSSLCISSGRAVEKGGTTLPSANETPRHPQAITWERLAR